MKFNPPNFLVKLTGDIYLHKYPMFVVFKPQHYKIKGNEVREILNKIKPGDILLRRFDGYLNTLLTPGFWGHAAIYVGDNVVIHAVKEGVIQEDILEFTRCDSLAILRYTGTEYVITINSALYLAYNFNIQKYQYDYDMMCGNGKVYCTEFVDSCYPGLFFDKYETIMGNTVLTPDGIFKSPKLEKILVIKH
jgi:hypothetical protein